MTNFRPQQKNVNQHSEHGLRLLEKSVQRDGFIDAQTAAADGEIISGSARLELSAEKFAEVEPIVIHSDGKRPVIVVRDDIPNADDPRAKRLSVAANQIAKTDFNPDGELLKEWGNEDKEIRAMFADSEWKEYTGEEKPTVDAEPQIDRDAELLEKWKVKTGDLWQIGEHRLICGDCTDKAVVARVMGNERAALAPVDPPYNVGFEYDGETVDDEKTEEKYKEFTLAWFSLCQSVSDKQIVTPGCNNLARWLRWFDPFHWSPWTKSNSMTNGKVSRFWCWEPVLFFGDKWKRARSNDIFDYPIGMQSGVGNHPCPKPLKMWQDLLENYSEEKDIIYESFNGSGTTLVACQNINRIGRAIDISPEYIALTLERMSQAFPHLEIKRLND